MLLLEVIGGVVMLAEGEGRHEHPFGDGRTVDSTACRYVDVRAYDDGVLGEVIDASREEVNELEAEEVY